MTKPVRTARLVPIEHDTPLEQAERIRRADDPHEYRRSILSEDEFMNIAMPERVHVVKGLIVEKTITIVNGFRGGGKSWFVDVLSNEISWGGQIGPWKVEKPLNCLKIDGEMPLSLLQERMRKMNAGRDVEEKPAKWYIYPESYAYRIGLNRANLLEAVWRSRIQDEIERLDIGLLVLDNLSSLCPGIDENDKTPFDAVNRWLLELRFNGVTIIMTHHTGKSGEQRGTSAHEDHVDTALVLEKPPGYIYDDGCKFVCTPTKDRDFIMHGESVTLQLTDDPDTGRSEFATVITKGGRGQAVLLGPTLTRSDARDLGISDRTLYRIRKQAEEEGVDPHVIINRRLNQGVDTGEKQ